MRLGRAVADALQILRHALGLGNDPVEFVAVAHAHVGDPPCRRRAEAQQLDKAQKFGGSVHVPANLRGRRYSEVG